MELVNISADLALALILVSRVSPNKYLGVLVAPADDTNRTVSLISVNVCLILLSHGHALLICPYCCTVLW